MAENRVFGRRILVVEDDPSARQSLKLLLDIDRHAVTEAEDGSAALNLLAEQPFDLVVMDYFMPGMHGGEVATWMKHLAPQLPIIMVSAYLEKLSGVEMPVSALLGKPYAVADLRREIARLLS